MINKLSYILWIGFFIILLNFNYAAASSESDMKCDQYFSNIEPSFSISVRKEKPTINPGDSLEFKININGYGAPPDSPKISVYLPIRFVDNNSEIFGNIKFVLENNTLSAPENLTSNDDYTDFHRAIPPFYFGYNSSGDLCQINAEKKIGGYQPITIKIHTSETVMEGDHNIYFVLSYSYGNKSYQDTQDATIHVNSWLEHSYTIYGISFSRQFIIEIIITFIILDIFIIPLSKYIRDKILKFKDFFNKIKRKIRFRLSL